MKIIVPHVPVVASRPRVTKWSTYFKEPYNSYKKYLGNFFKEWILENHHEIFPQYVPLRVDISFYMPIPKSTSKKKTLVLQEEETFHTKAFDLDNAEKAILDGMNKKIWYDDGQIARLSSEKVYSGNPRTEITITEL